LTSEAVRQREIDLDRTASTSRHLIHIADVA
jgi:hypothetical protein